MRIDVDLTLFDQKLRRGFCCVSDVPYGAWEVYLSHVRIVYRDEMVENGDVAPERLMEAGLCFDQRLAQLTTCALMNVIAAGRSLCV